MLTAIKNITFWLVQKNCKILSEINFEIENVESVRRKLWVKNLESKFFIIAAVQKPCWMDGWVGGWVEDVKAGLMIAYSNQQSWDSFKLLLIKPLLVEKNYECLVNYTPAS